MEGSWIATYVLHMVNVFGHGELDVRKANLATAAVAVVSQLVIMFL